jgi:hypothetical protein
VADIERDMLALIEGITVESPMEDVATAHGKVENLMRNARELKAMLEAALIPWCEQNGPITVGPMQTKAVAYENETKCQDVTGTVEAIMATDRGFAALGECLSVNALKPGACKKALAPEDFERLFVTTRKPVLRDGKPAKKLVTQNMDFVNTGN